MEMPNRSKLSSNWSLDPSCVFLNHGSFGATPIFVQEEQNRWRRVVENEPVKFYEDLAEKWQISGNLDPKIRKNGKKCSNFFVEILRFERCKGM